MPRKVGWHYLFIEQGVDEMIDTRRDVQHAHHKQGYLLYGFRSMLQNNFKIVIN